MSDSEVKTVGENSNFIVNGYMTGEFRNMSIQKIENFKGVIPAAISVFDKDELPDEAGTRAYIRYMMSFGIGGLYIAGSTGECFLMKSEERKRQVEIVMDEVAGRLPVVVHIGAMSTRESIALAEHAQSVGAAGISSVPPFYFKYTQDQIYGYYRDIAGAADLPLIVYNVPLAGLLTVDMIKRLAEIGNVKGVKYTGTALYEVTQIRDACKEGFQIYGGCDELGSSNIALGVDGIIGTFYNVIPDLYLRIWDAVKRSDVKEAAELQRKALHVISIGVGSGSMMACAKLWLRAAGIPAGYARRPFTNFEGEEGEKLVQKLLETDEKELIGLDVAKRIRENR